MTTDHASCLLSDDLPSNEEMIPNMDFRQEDREKRGKEKKQHTLMFCAEDQLMRLAQKSLMAKLKTT